MENQDGRCTKRLIKRGGINRRRRRTPVGRCGTTILDAEYAGDSLNLTIPEPGPSTIKWFCGAVRCVVVVITGRPVVIEPYLPVMDALVAAGLRRSRRGRRPLRGLRVHGNASSHLVQVGGAAPHERR
ncbi:hypothetical protein B296_00029861 [Ensete ventricosum]|uniref:beta-glucosidase n=1 Tax=Ensete ventricosum TaxID=4639 RepID=A0A426ZC65_ENSVE|nr:hypothetical protein B296_00029861 [Ensete ventricosum]